MLPVSRLNRKAMLRPTASLHSASRIWDMEVGTMLDWPWKKPRSAEIRQMKSIAGERQRIANQLSDWLMSPARALHKIIMPPEPTRPSARNAAKAVL